MDKSYREALNISVAGLLLESGFQRSEETAHEILTEIIKNLIRQVGLSAYSYCELSGRTEPVAGDVIMVLANMGLSVEGIGIYAMRPRRRVISPQSKLTQPKQECILQADKKQRHPSHIPAHFPWLPDPHAYIRTPAYKQPVTRYDKLREKASALKRCIERALTKFVDKTRETQFLFPTNESMFPLIACQFKTPPHREALLTSLQYSEMEGAFSSLSSDPDCQMPYRNCYEVAENEDGGNYCQAEGTDNPYLQPPRLPRIKIREIGDNNWEIC